MYAVWTPINICFCHVFLWNTPVLELTFESSLLPTFPCFQPTLIYQYPGTRKINYLCRKKNEDKKIISWTNYLNGMVLEISQGTLYGYSRDVIISTRHYHSKNIFCFTLQCETMQWIETEFWSRPLTKFSFFQTTLVKQ